MKIKNIISFVSGVVVYFLLKGLVFSYDNFNAHPTFNEAIVQFFEQNYKNYFPEGYSINLLNDKQLLNGKAVTNPGFLLATYAESLVNYTALEWIKHGGFSADEPELAASVRHFYDPIGLNEGKKYLTNRGTIWEGRYPNPQIDAIEWAMGDTPKGKDNLWRLEKGKESIIRAFDIADENMKKENLAQAFRCLGEVLHNTADMGCPPHTRNDSHAAPVGYEYGFILGSPDPYEELFNLFWVSSFMNSQPDPDFKLFCNNATNIRSINEKLAEFTNNNFFTQQTINGMGGYEILPINDGGTYPKPMLQFLEYDANSNTYYKTFSSGRKIKMAKDKSYFWKRGYPYIDKDCVESQASELVPNIVYAGANIIRLFIPQIKVVINSANSSGDLSGIVTHFPSQDYNSLIHYFGKVNFYKLSDSDKIGQLECNAGEFFGTIQDLEKEDEIYAEIEIGPIKIKSSTYKVGELQIEKNYKKAFIDLHVKGYHIRTNADTSYEDQYYKFYSTDSPDQIGTTEGLSFSSSWYQTTTDNYPIENTTITKSGTISITFSENYKSIKNYTETFSINWPGWYDNIGGVSVSDIPLYQSGDEWTPDEFRLDYGEDACNHVISRSYNQTWVDGSSFIFSRNECDGESYIRITLYEN
jgi:hypothetical protein